MGAEEAKVIFKERDLSQVCGPCWLQRMRGHCWPVQDPKGEDEKVGYVWFNSEGNQ